ncbi:hypothetical protein CDL15_Pgr004802 [Punica granatum]|uniref:RRM domain-containing protein n=1 Tax=Punica granatum TaxID=22663 RepID=A0A218W7M4_PUNGR|nr:hypothetical protein CDL15_Pgr004802 [Punica granatum]PKI57021.1 hypothetical protein CRG98_022525 [Punica granatum]
MESSSSMEGAELMTEDERIDGEKLPSGLLGVCTGTRYTRNRSEATHYDRVQLPGLSYRSHNLNPYYRAAAQVRPPTMFQDVGSLCQPQAGQGLAAEIGTKIYVSNLDYGVSNKDIKFFGDAQVCPDFGSFEFNQVVA